MTLIAKTPAKDDILVQEVRRRGERDRGWRSEADRSVIRRLGQIGVLGWIVVIPLLIGIFTGRWLDRTFHSGLFWTAPLLIGGALLGCWSAWRWMKTG